MMKKIIYLIAAVSMMASSMAIAAFPNYYPKGGLHLVGNLDDVQLKRQVVIINDISYSLADNVIVHSPSSFSVPTTQLRIGGKVGYRMATGGQLITEIWLLPRDYKSPLPGQ